MPPTPLRPARHELPAIDEAALVAARHADALLATARAVAATGAPGAQRWAAFLEPLPERLRDALPAELRSVARRARAAYGPKDSILDVLPVDLAIGFRDAIDDLARVLARHDALEPRAG
jgi:hypothetical protein